MGGGITRGLPSVGTSSAVFSDRTVVSRGSATRRDLVCDVQWWNGGRDVDARTFMSHWTTSCAGSPRRQPCPNISTEPGTPEHGTPEPVTGPPCRLWNRCDPVTTHRDGPTGHGSLLGSWTLRAFLEVQKSKRTNSCHGYSNLHKTTSKNNVFSVKLIFSLKVLVSQMLIYTTITLWIKVLIAFRQSM